MSEPLSGLSGHIPRVSEFSDWVSEPFSGLSERIPGVSSLSERMSESLSRLTDCIHGVSGHASVLMLLHLICIVDAKINTLESEGKCSPSHGKSTKRASQFDHSTDKVKIILLRSKGIGQSGRFHPGTSSDNNTVE